MNLRLSVKEKSVVIIISCLLFALNGFTQSQDSITLSIPEVIVSIPRIPNQPTHAPFAISKSDLKNEQLFFQNNSLQELLGNQVGIFDLNANNHAQDLRISIRGFGARSAFGIRGIKIIVDGIPETTPDGQGQIDNLNLNAMESIEILRGPASGLYGNASGGVINIKTANNLESNTFKIKSSFGSFQSKKVDLFAGLKFQTSTLLLNYSFFDKVGYRSNSASQTSIFSVKWIKKLNEKISLVLNTNYTDSPKAQDPGGITLEDALITPETARQQNIDFKAGESITHFKSSATLHVELDNAHVESHLFLHDRKFDGRLPFRNGGAIDLHRHFFGHSTTIQFDKDYTKWESKSIMGYDIHFQNDLRKRFINDMGIVSDLTLDQNEIFNNLALYATESIRLKNKLNVNLDVRYDYNHIKNEDHFLIDGDDSSQINYNSLNYSLGLGLLSFNSLYPFIRIASSFETPTLSELSAQPLGGGFNLDLKPISSTNYELGMRFEPNTKLSVTGNLFHIQSSNEILPFELEDFPEKDFFRNTGKTSRTGIELSAKYTPSEIFSTLINYNYSNFKFKDFEINGVDLSGNKLPGIPTQSLSINLNYQLPYNIRLFAIGKYNDKLFADNQNDEMVDAYSRVDIKVSKYVTLKQTKLNLFVGMNNLFNTTYFDNIRLNAFGNRYYEAAEPINYYIGFGLKF